MTELQVRASEQALHVMERGSRVRSYPVSTSRHGLGEVRCSFKTPRGLHYVRAKIGEGLPAGSVLVGRRPTGEVMSGPLAKKDASRDWITSRILWLGGLEPGRNRSGKVDTMSRYIYIHGTPHVAAIGTAASEGCVRMRDGDVIELFDMVDVGTRVMVTA